MKPDFALNFTHDSIGLLHRTTRGWLEVGAAALDEPDLAEALGYLRRSALGLSPAGFTTKLIIPNSQVLYLTVAAPGPDGANRKAQVRTALEGRTPYAVDDLVFDWWGTGPEVHAAVVARETLDEAEAFAAQYRFNPVAFVSIPEDAAFGGEPWFGSTAHAATLLRPGEKVERDQDPVSIIARELPRVAPDEPAAATVDVADAPVAIEAAVGLSDTVVPDVTVTPPEPVPAPEVAASLVVADLPSDGPSPSESESTPDPDPAIDPDADTPDQPDQNAPSMAVGQDVPIPPVMVAKADQPPAPMIETRPLPVRRFGAPVVPGDVTDSQVIEPEAAVTFASRRSRSLDGGGTGPEPTPLQTALAEAARGMSGTEPTAGQGTATAPVPKLRAPTETISAIGSADTVASAMASTSDAIPVRPVRAPASAALAADPRLGTVAAKAPIAARTVAAVASPKPVADPRRDPIRPRTAVSDGLGSRPVAVSGKPRFLGLILTGVLLLLLAVVAAWSSFYLASGDADAPALVTAPSNESGLVPETAAASNGVDDGLPLDPPAASPQEAAAPIADVVPPAEATVEAVVPVDVPAVPAADTLVVATASPDTVAPQPAVPSPVDDTASTEVAASQDKIILPTSDTPPAVGSAAPSPTSATAPDPVPAAQLAPPPFGTVYAFDAAGRIVPTPEGVVTPEGIMLFAGRPIKVPPSRPAPVGVAKVLPAAIDPAEVPPIEGGASPDATAGGIAAVADVPASTPDPALSGLKPRTRPAGVAPTQDDASAPVVVPAVDPRLAGLRPAARPAEIVAAVSARQQTKAASLAIAGASEASPSGSLLAVAISGRPAPRPGNFSKAVESAVAAAVRDAPPEEVEVAAAPAPAAQATLRVRQPTIAEEPARIAPEDDGEPEQASAPVRSVNNRGTVAKNATFANAINLRDINLIGVYGSQSNRYALIRQANGRYKKVSVGDRIGGGVIAAITADEVRYQKGNRMYALEMPRG